MDKTIENKLFDEFRNGAASMCLEYFKEKEDWKDAPNEYLAYNDTDKVLSQIKERTEVFDDIAWPMGRGDSFPLAEELISNLDSCSTDKQRENYIIDILVVFKDWAAIFSPIAEINEMKKAIELSQNDDEYGMLEQYKDSLDYLEGLHDHYLEIMEKPKEGTIEYYFNLWHRCYHQFCSMLAAELAKYGMNLLEIQNKRGIWLVEKLDTLSIQAYFGISNNFGYANNLLEELNAPTTQHLIFTVHNGVKSNWISNDRFNLPKELDTPKCRKYFERAIECGYMECTTTGAKWNGMQVKLGYMCSKTFDKPRPITSLEKYFGVTKLSASITQSEIPAIRNDVKKWRSEMDEQIFFD